MAPKSAAEAQQCVSKADGETFQDPDDLDRAIKEMAEAADVLKEAKDNRGFGRALRLLCGFKVAKAQTIRMKYGRSAPLIAPILEDVDSMLNKNLETFRGAGDKYGEANMLLSMAEFCAFEEDNDKSKQGIDAAVMGSKIANELGEKSLEARCEYATAMAQALLKDTDAAVASAAKGIQLFEEVGDKRSMVKLYSVMASAYDVRDRHRDMHAAARKGLAIAREVDDKKLIEALCQAIADWHLRDGQLKDALPFAKEALAISESLPPQSGGHGEVSARRCIMCIYSLKGDMTAALKLALETVDKFEARGQKTELLMAYDSLCHMHLRKADGEKALRAAEAALEIAREVGDKRWESIILKTISETLVNMSQFHAAEGKMKEALEVTEEMGEEEEQANMLHDQCVLELNSGKYEAAYQTAQEELNHAEKTSCKQGKAYAYVNLALSAAAKGNMDEATEFGNEGLEIFSEMDDIRGQANLHRAMTEIYCNDRDFEQALEHVMLMRDAFDNIGDVQGKADAQRLMADVYLCNEDAEEAVTAASAARQLAKKSDDKRKQVDMLMGLASAQLKLITAKADKSKDKRVRGSAKALRPAREARALAKKIGDKNILGNATYILAEIQACVGRVDEALKGALASASIFREICDVSNEVIALVLCGEIMHAKGETEKAKETVEHAYRIAEKAGDKYGQHISSKCLEDMAPETKAAPGQAAGPSAVGESYQEESKLQATSAGLDPEFVKKMVSQTVLSVIGGDEDGVMWDSPLMDVGMDSLSSVQFRNELQRQAGFNLPAAMIFDYPTQAQIADHLVEQSKIMGK